jgi:hypothetical protein
MEGRQEGCDGLTRLAWALRPVAACMIAGMLLGACGGAGSGGSKLDLTMQLDVVALSSTQTRLQWIPHPWQPQPEKSHHVLHANGAFRPESFLQATTATGTD